MQNKVYADTSTLIILSKINQFDLLRLLYGKIYISQVIEKEFGLAIPKWIIVENIESELIDKQHLDLDKGAASIICLAIQHEHSILIIDDLKARIVASKLNLKYTGTIGLLLTAKNLGYINEIKTSLEKIMKTDFRISSDLLNSALQYANEL